jgi:hypothetical protein
MTRQDDVFKKLLFLPFWVGIFLKDKPQPYPPCTPELVEGYWDHLKGANFERLPPNLLQDAGCKLRQAPTCLEEWDEARQLQTEQ